MNSTECEAEATTALNKPKHDKGCWSFAAVGCVEKPNGIFFNTCEGKKATDPTYKPICVKVTSKLLRMTYSFSNKPFILISWSISFLLPLGYRDGEFLHLFPCEFISFFEKWYKG